MQQNFVTRETHRPAVFAQGNINDCSPAAISLKRRGGGESWRTRFWGFNLLIDHPDTGVDNLSLGRWRRYVQQKWIWQICCWFWLLMGPEVTLTASRCVIRRSRGHSLVQPTYTVALVTRSLISECMSVLCRVQMEGGLSVRKKNRLTEQRGKCVGFLNVTLPLPPFYTERNYSVKKHPEKEKVASGQKKESESPHYKVFKARVKVWGKKDFWGFLPWPQPQQHHCKKSNLKTNLCP